MKINAKVKTITTGNYGIEIIESIYENVVRIFNDKNAEKNTITIVYEIEYRMYERATFETDGLQIELQIDE